MPTPRTWLPRITEIIEILRLSPAKELDRAAIEKLFEIQRRSAITLIKQVGALKRGDHHVVARKSLLTWVQHIEATESQEVERRRQVAADIDHSLAEHRAVKLALEQKGKSAVEFTLPREVLEATLDSLPPEIHLAPGRIEINFSPSDPIQACQMLYALGLALANDFESFRSLVLGT